MGSTEILVRKYYYYSNYDYLNLSLAIIMMIAHFKLTRIITPLMLADSFMMKMVVYFKLIKKEWNIILINFKYLGRETSK